MKKNIKDLACRRCGYIGDLEKHHKKHKAEGGSDADPNRIWFCQGCHDYTHAKETVLKAIKQEEHRLKVLRARLEIIEKENTSESILRRGYQPYFRMYSELLPANTKCGKQ